MAAGDPGGPPRDEAPAAPSLSGTPELSQVVAMGFEAGAAARALREVCVGAARSL